MNDATSLPPPWPRIDRRTAIHWCVLAAASLQSLRLSGADSMGHGFPRHGYGMNPDLEKTYRPGALWPLTLTPTQRLTVAALCDTIIPGDIQSPAASTVGVPDFIDEWISAPYGASEYSKFSGFSFGADRLLILDGLAWLEAESVRRFGKIFMKLAENEKTKICDDICYLPGAKVEFQAAARFFARIRDLTAGGFYTTPAGVKDLKYVGNTPLAQFDGPPPEVLRKVGLI